MLAFEVRQRGEIPVESVTRMVVDQHRAAVTLLLNELTKNVSGQVVATRRGRLRAGLFAKVTSHQGELVGTVGFNKRVAFITRFLETGTKAHELGKGARLARQAFIRRRASRARLPFSGRRNTILRFVAGGQVLFRRGAFHPGLRPRPILEAAAKAVQAQVDQNLRAALPKALDNA